MQTPCLGIYPPAVELTCNKVIIPATAILTCLKSEVQYSVNVGNKDGRQVAICDPVSMLKSRKLRPFGDSIPDGIHLLLLLLLLKMKFA